MKYIVAYIVCIFLAATLLEVAKADQPNAGDCRHIYSAYITDIYDGDTFTADIDLGLGTWRRGETVRLYGVDAPELRGPSRAAGLESRDWLRYRMYQRGVTLATLEGPRGSDRRGKYGRLLAVVWDPAGNINDDLLWYGMADEREY